VFWNRDQPPLEYVFSSVEDTVRLQDPFRVFFHVIVTRRSIPPFLNPLDIIACIVGLP